MKHNFWIYLFWYIWNPQIQFLKFTKWPAPKLELDLWISYAIYCHAYYIWYLHLLQICIFKTFFYLPCVPIYKTAHCTYKKVILQAMFVVFFPWWQLELLTRDSPVSGGTRLPLEWQQWILFRLVVKTVAICVRKIIAFSYIISPTPPN